MHLLLTWTVDLFKCFSRNFTQNRFYSLQFVPKMTFLYNLGAVLLLVCFVSAQQRIAPGVPPQQYQQAPPPQYQQQYQQVPAQPQYQQGGYQQQQQPQYQQQQQVPQTGYQQQPPQQAYQQQVPQQQVPQQHVPQQQQVPVQQVHQQPHGQQGHGHGHHGHGQPVLNTANIQQEKEHIASHMDVPIDTSKMSEAELQFHYFKMHDSDNNNKLDGCELIKSLIHWHEQGSKGHNHGADNQEIQEKIFSDEELVALIDPILQMDDTSQDGFIDYPEFMKAQQKAAATPPKQQ